MTPIFATVLDEKGDLFADPLDNNLVESIITQILTWIVSHDQFH